MISEDWGEEVDKGIHVVSTDFDDFFPSIVLGNGFSCFSKAFRFIIKLSTWDILKNLIKTFYQANITLLTKAEKNPTRNKIKS